MSESTQILRISFWIKFLRDFRNLLPFLFACFWDIERLFVVVYVFCSLVLFEDFHSGLSLAVILGIDYPSGVHLNLVPVETSSPEWYDPLHSQMKFPWKVERGIPPMQRPTQSQTHSVSHNQNKTLSMTLNPNPSRNLPQKEFTRPFPPSGQKIFAEIHYFSKSHCLVTNELRKKDSDKDRSLPSLRGPTRLRKLRHVSESPKRHWISAPESFSFAFFDPKTKTNCEGETLYRAPISVTPSGSRMQKISSSRIFFWVSF